MKAVPPIKADKMEQVALTWPERAQALEILDQTTYDMAVRFLADVNRFEKVIVDYHKDMKADAHKAWKTVCEREKMLLDPVLKAKETYRRKIAVWTEEQERARREEERRLAVEAAAEEERLREEMVRQAEELGVAPEQVEEIRMTSIGIPRQIVAPKFQAASGISTQVRYRVEVTDLRALCRAVGEGKVSEAYVMPSMTALNKLASAEKEALNIPGVRIIRDTGIMDRRPK